MASITITVDDKAVRNALKGVQNQAPFALALATSNVTKDAQGAIREGYQSAFTLRRPDFIYREGAKITKFATKRDPVAILQVSEKAGFLVKFEEGDEKVPREGRAIAVPLAVRRNKNDLIPASLRPPALYRSKGGQQGRIWSQNGRLWQAVGRGKNAIVRALYAWKSSVRVKPILRFHKRANEAVDKHWVQRATEAAERALATMR